MYLSDADTLSERLRREWPANKLIGDLYFETIVALDAWNPLGARLYTFSSVGNMNLLFSFTACALHRHRKVTFI